MQDVVCNREDIVPRNEHDDAVSAMLAASVPLTKVIGLALATQQNLIVTSSLVR